MIPVRWLKRSACDLCLWCRESEIYLRSVYTERLSIFHCFIYPKVYRFASWNPVKVKRYIHLLVHERNVACSPESLSRVLQYNLTHLMLNPISSRNSAILLRIPSPLNIPWKFYSHQWQTVVEILPYVIVFLLSLLRRCAWRKNFRRRKLSLYFWSHSVICSFSLSSRNSVLHFGWLLHRTLNYSGG